METPVSPELEIPQDSADGQSVAELMARCTVPAAAEGADAPVRTDRVLRRRP